MNKGEGHRKRLRDKFLTSGLSGFHDYEVIELLLTLATPRKDCKNEAKEALIRFKTFQGVIEASVSQLCEIKGIGAINVFGIKLIKAVCDRYLEKKLISKDYISNSKELFEYLFNTLRDKNRESFNVIFLDAKNNIISLKMLFEGTLTSSQVYPREVIKAALENHAAALIFAHNHPSGDPSPSKEDIAITKQLIFACKVMGITVHDHIIIGDSKYFSLADNGYINKMNQEYNEK
ncbi:MAG: DNA repair protein RadC [Desulfobacterales bacterium]|nr:DNA repair protein RadC [Desulfobacterales bacterium]MBF0397098.1 DNA repair protein RadC [Desulfobacterales bacterium]